MFPYRDARLDICIDSMAEVQRHPVIRPMQLYTFMIVYFGNILGMYILGNIVVFIWQQYIIIVCLGRLFLNRRQKMGMIHIFIDVSSLRNSRAIFWGPTNDSVLSFEKTTTHPTALCGYCFKCFMYVMWLNACGMTVAHFGYFFDLVIIFLCKYQGSIF